jgi:hypothetical protein
MSRGLVGLHEADALLSSKWIRNGYRGGCEGKRGLAEETVGFVWAASSRRGGDLDNCGMRNGLIIFRN